MLTHKAAANALAELSLPEAEFLDEIQTKSLVFTVISAHGLYSPTPLKCESFHLTDFFCFHTTKPLWVSDFRAENKSSKFSIYMGSF
jgi:hypothetical protein